MASIKLICGIENVAFAFKTPADAWRTFDGPLGRRIGRELATLNIFTFPEHLGRRLAADLQQPPLPSARPTIWEAQSCGVSSCAVLIDSLQTLGAVPTTIEVAEAYAALQTHVVDGLSTTLSGAESFRFYEVQKYLSLTAHSWTGYWLIANGDVWRRLPDSSQRAVLRNAAKYATMERTANAQLDRGSVGRFRQYGLAVNTPDPAPFRARLGPHYARFRPQFGDAAWTELQNSGGPFRIMFGEGLR